MKNQNLLERFDALLGPKIEQPPKGFFTAEEIAQRHGLSSDQMGKKLNRLVTDGKAVRMKGRNANGRVCWFYGVK